MAITKIVRLASYSGVIHSPVPKRNLPCPVPNSIQIQGSKETELLLRPVILRAVEASKLDRELPA
jgi:hypothetical protein